MSRYAVTFSNCHTWFDMWNLPCDFNMWNFTGRYSHVKFHIKFFVCEIPYVKSRNMWNFTCEISHVKFHMWKFHMGTFTCDISHVKFHMWNFTCENPHVKFHMWNFTCEISHVKFHMWNLTCEISHVKFHMWKAVTCEISHVKFHMWLFTCETYVKHILIAHVKIIPSETHGIWDSHVFLELHMCETHGNHMRNFCKGLQRLDRAQPRS